MRVARRAPLDTAERRNLGRYVKNLIEKHEVGVADLLRFSGHYATRRSENPRIKPSQAWADVAKGSGGGSYSTAVIGASEDLFEGDF